MADLLHVGYEMCRGDVLGPRAISFLSTMSNGAILLLKHTTMTDDEAEGDQTFSARKSTPTCFKASVTIQTLAVMIIIRPT